VAAAAVVVVEVIVVVVVVVVVVVLVIKGYAILSSRKEGRNASLMDTSLRSTLLSLSNGSRNADTSKRTFQHKQ